jgi:hypothetical protein
MSTLWQKFTPDEQNAGWPETLKPVQLAALQYPYAIGDVGGRRYENLRATAILNACKRGDLPHTATTESRQVSPERTVDTLQKASLFGAHARVVYTVPAQTKDVTEYLIAAPAFKAWLAARPEKASAHIAAWFEAVLVPTDETIKDRNDRWLAFYEAEEKAGRKTGAVQRGANHFNAERSLYGRALKEARARRAEKYRADIKAVPAKGGAGGWGSQLVKDGKKTKGTKA